MQLRFLINYYILKIIKQAITDMLSPVVQYNGTAFMIAIGSVWGEKRKRSKLNQEHKVIIEIMKSLKICYIPVILQNITEILKQSNINNKDKVTRSSIKSSVFFLNLYFIEKEYIKCLVTTVLTFLFGFLFTVY